MDIATNLQALQKQWTAKGEGGRWHFSWGGGRKVTYCNAVLCTAFSISHQLRWKKRYVKEEVSHSSHAWPLFHLCVVYLLQTTAY